MNISQERLYDIGVIAVLAVGGFMAINAFGSESTTVSQRVEATRSTVEQLTTKRDELLELPDMDKLTRTWAQSRQIITRCGVDRSVIAGDGRETLYAGAGAFWTAQISGNAVAVLSCADQISELTQVAFEDVSIASDDETHTAQVTFSMYGTLTPDAAE